MRRLAQHRSVPLSIAIHGLLIGAVAVAYRIHGPVLAPMHMAGTAQGTAILPAFQLLGSPPGVASAKPSAHTRGPAPPVTHKSPSAHAKQMSAPADPSAVGDASEGSLGDGDISIALVQFHPRPQPDLSSLPAGSSGDVVLDVLIDADGHVSHLSVNRSLGPAVDGQVIATVQHWTFTPAKRNGTPIASEQQILFHYERSQAG